MNKFLLVCMLIFITQELGVEVFPHFFFNIYVSISIHCVLSVLLSFGLVLSIFKLGSRNVTLIAPIMFAFMFCFVAVKVAYSNFAAVTIYEQAENISDRNRELLKIYETGANKPDEERRKFGAQILYREYGVVVPYTTTENILEKYQPSSIDLELYNQSNKTRLEMQRLLKRIGKANEITLYKSLISILCFFFSIVFVTYRAKKLIS